MSHFYAKINQSARKTIPTARGHKSTGIGAKIGCWDGGIQVSIEHDDATGEDHYQVRKIDWITGATKEILAEGKF